MFSPSTPAQERSSGHLIQAGESRRPLSAIRSTDGSSSLSAPVAARKRKAALPSCIPNPRHTSRNPLPHCLYLPCPKKKNNIEAARRFFYDRTRLEKFGFFFKKELSKIKSANRS